MSLAAILIALGITIGTGSLYRFIYSYNLIMAVTLFTMFVVVFFQQFIPITSNNQNSTRLLDQKFSIPGIILISFMIFFPIFSDIINLSFAYEIIYFYIAMVLLSFLLDYKFREKILQIYLLIIVILSVISIVFLYFAIFTDILSSIPQMKLNIKMNSNFFYVFSYSSDMVWFRNQSIFWEPGAFGFHLIFATLLAYKKNNKLFIVILILTSITTFSTTVFIFLILLSLYHILLGKNKFKSFVFILSIVCVSITAVIIFMDSLLIPQLIQNALIGKFKSSSSSYISFVGRTSFTIEALKMFLDNIFLGAGHYATAERLEVVKSGSTVNTSGFAGLLAEFGLFGIFSIFLYTRYFWHFSLLAIPMTIIWLNGEFLQYSPLALLILVHSADEFSYRLFPPNLTVIEKSS